MKKRIWTLSLVLLLCSLSLDVGIYVYGRLFGCKADNPRAKVAHPGLQDRLQAHLTSLEKTPMNSFLTDEFRELGYFLSGGVALKEGTASKGNVVAILVPEKTHRSQKKNSEAAAVLVELARLLREEVYPQTIFLGLESDVEKLRTFDADHKDVRIILDSVGNHSAQVQRYDSFLGRFHRSEGDFLALVSNQESRGLLDASSSVLSAFFDSPLQCFRPVAHLPNPIHYDVFEETSLTLVLTDTDDRRASSVPNVELLADLTAGMFRLVRSIARDGSSNSSKSIS